MIKELSRLENVITKITGLKITNVTEDQECEEYFGFNFQIEQLSLKFRKAKITPKKTGQFVTLWKRNTEKKTEPFNVKDNFDFYVIAAEEDKKFGFFLFPKNILNEKQILTNNKKEGKRGFRVYPDWNIPGNEQAKKTKIWQANYFIDLTSDEYKNIEKFNSILKSN